jgi:hypothetical protein
MFCLVCECESRAASPYCEFCGYALVEESPAGAPYCMGCRTMVSAGDAASCAECGTPLKRLAFAAASERADEWGRETQAATPGACLACGGEVAVERQLCAGCEEELRLVATTAGAGLSSPVALGAGADEYPAPASRGEYLGVAPSLALATPLDSEPRGRLQRIYADCYAADAADRGAWLSGGAAVGSPGAIPSSELPDFEAVYASALAPRAESRRRALRLSGLSLALLAIAAPGWLLYLRERSREGAPPPAPAAAQPPASALTPPAARPAPPKQERTRQPRTASAEHRRPGAPRGQARAAESRPGTPLKSALAEWLVKKDDAGAPPSENQRGEAGRTARLDKDANRKIADARP